MYIYVYIYRRPHGRFSSHDSLLAVIIELSRVSVRGDAQGASKEVFADKGFRYRQFAKGTGDSGPEFIEDEPRS